MIKIAKISFYFILNQAIKIQNIEVIVYIAVFLFLRKNFEAFKMLWFKDYSKLCEIS